MIAVDGMGGDFAPEVVVRGAFYCAKEHGISILLFGQEERLKELLFALDPFWQHYPITVSAANSTILMEEEVLKAVRKKRDSSLVQAVSSVKNGQCEAVVSAGNSGALMVAALFVLGCVPGVDRPAIVGMLPGVSGRVVCLDLGANVNCKAKYLYQFAHLGSQYASETLGIKFPVVALLSNGEEVGKGNLLTKQAFTLLKQSKLNFYGNIEPFDILKNRADVVVCDGFAGNILLKSFEAVAAISYSILEQEIAKVIQLLGDKGEQLLCSLDGKIKSKERGGALLLGVKKPVVVVHGDATAQEMKRAILFAHKVVHQIKIDNYKVDECKAESLEKV